MSENLMAKVAANLRAIIDMQDRLEAEAINSANDPLMPGGKAMVSLGHVASLQAWAWQVDALERAYIDAKAEGYDVQPPDLTADHDDWEPPLQTLLFWSEGWRAEHDMELDGRRPTPGTEANFLRWCLNWAWDNEPRFEDFMRDVATARRRLEDTLSEGTRPERTRVVCPDCEQPPQLIRVYGGADPAEDKWKCPKCKRRFDEDDHRKAHAKQLRSAAAERYVPWLDALATLKSQGRPERTIRKWMEPDDEGDQQVKSYREDGDRLMVWWPDLWHLHLITKMRKRSAA